MIAPNHPNDLVAQLLDGASRTWLGSLPYDVYGPIMAEAACRLTTSQATIEGLERERDALAADLHKVQIELDADFARAETAEAAVAELRAALDNIPNAEILLHMGELSAQEMRAVRAFIGWQSSRLRALPNDRSGS